MMARFCDEQAEICGEQVVEAGESKEQGKVVEGGDLGKDLADTVANAAGDCCVPKSQRK